MEAADTDGRRRAGHVPLQHDHAWRLGDQEVRQVGDRRLLHLRGDITERLDRVAQLDTALLANRRGDDFGELDDRRRHGEVEGDRAARWHRDRLLLLQKAYAKDTYY